MFDDLPNIVAEHLPFLLEGVEQTLFYTAVAGALALVIGAIVGLIRAYRVPGLNLLARAYVDVIRGTPLLVQIFFIFFGIPLAIGRPVSAAFAGILVLAVHEGAYFSEIIRGAVRSVPRSQTEGARSMGLTWLQTLRHVIAPQAFLTALPALGNQLIITLKDTSLLAIISVSELTRNGQIVIANTFQAFQIWLVVAVLYLILTGILSGLLSILERRASQYLPAIRT